MNLAPSPHRNISAAGIVGSGVCPMLYPLSYGGSRRRQESNLRPSDPDVTRAFTTPQTLESLPYFIISLFPYFLTSSLPARAHTHSVHFRQRRIASPIRSREKFREELTFTVIRDSNPSLAALPLK
jgi:hypothetical protein